jgi:hypothetical protein
VAKNVQDMKDADITPEEFAAHCVYLNEYWIKNKVTKTGRLHKIVDLKGFGLSQMSQKLVDWFSPMNHAMQQYPELIVSIKIINAPSTFRWLWKMIQPFLAKKTTDKISMVSGGDKEIAKELLKTIPAGILLKEFGGTWALPFKEIPTEIETADYTRRLNLNNSVESIDDWLPKPPPPVAPALAAPPTPGGASPGGEPAKARPTPLARAASIKRPNFAMDSPGGAKAAAKGMGMSDEDLNFLEQLVGQWNVDKLTSEPMDPILELQGMNYVTRKAATAFNTLQTVQMTGTDTRVLTITTKTGPVLVQIEGEVNQGGAHEVKNAVKTGEETAVIRLVRPAPPHLAEDADAAVEIAFQLPNGDRRVVHHVVSRTDIDKKVMSIRYVRAKDSKEATVIIISKRLKVAQTRGQ